MSCFAISRTALAAAGLITLTAAAAAVSPAAAAASPPVPCFNTMDWQGWKSPSPDVIYLGVRLHDVYKVTLSAGSSQLQSGDVHLVSIVRGSSNICSAIDLDLKLSDNHGFVTPLIAATLTKLTPEEIAAIPRKYRP